MRILLVEDDPSLSRFVAKGLLEAGHQLEIIDNGKHALALCMTEQFDVAYRRPDDHHLISEHPTS